MIRLFCCVAACSVTLLAAPKQKPPSGAAQLKRSCTRCHRLQVVHAQRLSREEWDRELDKMTSMGAKIGDRPALLDYLEKHYGDASSPRR